MLLCASRQRRPLHQHLPLNQARPVKRGGRGHGLSWACQSAAPTKRVAAHRSAPLCAAVANRAPSPWAYRRRIRSGRDPAPVTVRDRAISAGRGRRMLTAGRKFGKARPVLSPRGSIRASCRGGHADTGLVAAQIWSLACGFAPCQPAPGIRRQRSRRSRGRNGTAGHWQVVDGNRTAGA